MGSVLLCRVDAAVAKIARTQALLKDEGKVWRGNRPKEDCRLGRDEGCRVRLLASARSVVGEW